MSERSGVSGWLKRVFGAADKTAAVEQPAAADSVPRPLPKEGPRPAPVTPAALFKPSADDDDLDSLTIVPGPDSDGADGLEALRKEIIAELEAERAKQRK